MIKTDHYLTDYQVKELDKIKENTGISISELIRRAVDEYLTNGKNVKAKPIKITKKAII